MTTFTPYRYVLLCSLVLSLMSASAFFSPLRPKLHPQQQAQRLSTDLAAAIREGDSVLVIGGTSGVGQLVTKKLVPRKFDVSLTSRNVARGQETVGDDSVSVVELDLVNGSDDDIAAAVKGKNALVISVGTTAFPTTKWANGNNPEAIDKVAVGKIADAAAREKSLKKIVLLTSVGVDRTGEMPFLILNLFGVLDAKKSGEKAIMSSSEQGKFDYAIIRPGRLVGGPYTNPDFTRLLQIEGGADNGVDVQAGDSLLGDCKRDACAEAVIQCLVNENCKDVAFSIVSNEEKALTDEQWTTAFQNMAS